jgi:hypothetical protein
MRPFSIKAPSGRFLRNENATDFTHSGGGNGTSKPEIYYAQDPVEPSNINGIKPGAPATITNAATGRFCRLANLTAPVPGSCNATQGLLCDQATATSATKLLYTGNGFSYNGVPMVETPSGVLVLSSDPDCSSSPGGGPFTFPVVCEWWIDCCPIVMLRPLQLSKMQYHNDYDDTALPAQRSDF